MTNSKAETFVTENILNGFINYFQNFKKLTKQAPIFFKERKWKDMQSLHKNRLRLYKDQTKLTINLINTFADKRLEEAEFWKKVKTSYSEKIATMPEKELAETYFNSIIRKAYKGFVINETIMYIHEGYSSCDIHSNSDLFYTYPSDWGLQRIIKTILADFDFEVEYLNKEADIQFLVRSVREVILSRYQIDDQTTTQVLKNVFYRSTSAYLIGRTKVGGKWMPFIIPFLHGPKGVFVDTMIFDPKVMAHLFSFTRSYFMVEVAIPSQLVGFLNSVITHKQIHELYNAIGFNKHGKTEFYRDFRIHLQQSEDQFIEAAGVRGMVMTVFTLPSYNIVFKLIKDYFDPPKNMTRQEVKDKYKLVGLHDRVGRMADTHEFEEFHLPLDRIAPSLLQELKNTVNSLLTIKNNELIISHVYTERRMIPLNLYLEVCSTEDAKLAVEEYGNAIIQLAKANIFPGDMMTKNFGVTRQKRVVFYDYDEIEFLTDVTIRWKPKAETYEQIYASEPWYDIAPKDVFPEDFKRFMIGRADVKEHFFEVHKNLFDPDYWTYIQSQIRQGELLHTFPYPKSIRFRIDEGI